MENLIRSELEYKVAVKRLLDLMNDINLDATWNTEFSELIGEIHKFKKSKVTQNATPELSTQN